MSSNSEPPFGLKSVKSRLDKTNSDINIVSKSIATLDDRVTKKDNEAQELRNRIEILEKSLNAILNN